MSAKEGTPDQSIHLQGVPEHLPVFSDSIDSLILYHALEFSSDPHQVLREAERVLVPEGHIVILGFNPQSLWGLTKILKFRSKDAPWCGRFLSTLRLKDWLALKGFEVTTIRHCFYRPPVQRAGLLARLAKLERWGNKWWSFLGGVYIIVARKKVSTVTPIKPRWRPRRSIDPVLGDSATRSYRRNG
jgi:SAM-dependent methyltransferase